MHQIKFQPQKRITRGIFHIYQAVNGALMLSVGKKAITLTRDQVNTLPIDCNALADFDLNSFNLHYTLNS